MKAKAWSIVTSLLISSLVYAQQGQFHCYGTEPFWDLQVSQDSIHFKTLDHKTQIKKTQPRQSANHTLAQFRLYQTKTQKDQQQVIIAINKVPCSDGMSDHIHPYHVALLIGEKIFDGCCRQAVDGPAQKAE